MLLAAYSEKILASLDRLDACSRSIHTTRHRDMLPGRELTKTKGEIMVRHAAFVGLLVVGCGSEPARPDPTGSGGASAASASAAMASAASTNAAATSSQAATTSAASTAASTSGAGGNGPMGGGFESGSRLKTRTLIATDGAQLPEGLYDSQLQTNCGFQLASDGVLRCLPITSAMQVYFTNAACSLPVALLGAGCSSAPFVTLSNGIGCGGNVEYDAYQVGAIVSVPAPVFIKSGQSCVGPLGPYPGPFYAVTIVPPSSFVQATEQIGP